MESRGWKKLRSGRIPWLPQSSPYGIFQAEESQNIIFRTPPAILFKLFIHKLEKFRKVFAASSE